MGPMGRGGGAVQAGPNLWDHITRITCNVCRPPWAENKQANEFQRGAPIQAAHAFNGSAATTKGSGDQGADICAMLAKQIMNGKACTFDANPDAELLPSEIEAKKAAYRIYERANALQNRGAEANRQGDPYDAYRLFERAMKLMPMNPVHVLSAANMQLKIGLAAPRTRLSPAFKTALGLFERASELRLTVAQRKLLEAKRSLAEDAVGAFAERSSLAKDQEAAARNTVTQLSLSPTKNGPAPRDFSGASAKSSNHLTAEQQQAMLDLGLDTLPRTREQLRGHVRLLLETFHPDKQAARPEGLRLEPTIATTFIRRIKLAAARLMEAIQDEDEGYYV